MEAPGKGHSEVVVDGPFGRVVTSFQADHGLAVDGRVGAGQTCPALIQRQP
jgi:peptidoglycan hydrolase-like protein with peptidoglycan-binding domain